MITTTDEAFIRTLLIKNRKTEIVIEEGCNIYDINTKDNVYEQSINCPPFGWEKFMAANKGNLSMVAKVLDRKDRQPYYPCNAEMFTALHLCSLQNVKVVIIGLDPYPSEQNAVGMSFSGRRGGRIPPSLRNVINEVIDNYPDISKPDDGWLGTWANRGVLMLNSRLTHHPKSTMDKTEIDFWKGFVNNICEEVKSVNPKVIVMLWGREAERGFSGKFGTQSTELIATHPSPRAFGGKSSFLGCKHFLMANEALIKQGKTEIDWSF